jgi:hypothetical protein
VYRLIYGKGTGMHGEVTKQISPLMVMFDRGLCPADPRAETENERVEAGNG